MRVIQYTIDHILEATKHFSTCNSPNCPCGNTYKKAEYKLHCLKSNEHTNNDQKPSMTLKLWNNEPSLKCWANSNHNSRALRIEAYKLLDKYATETGTPIASGITGRPQEITAPTEIASTPGVATNNDTPNTVTPNTHSIAQEEFDLKEYITSRNYDKKVVKAFKLKANKALLEQPYINAEGTLVAVKYRKNNGDKFWRTGDQQGNPYGLHLLSEYKEAKHKILNIVEGESDTHAVYSNGYAVLGTSGTPHAFNLWNKSIYETFEEVHIWLDWGGKGLGNLDSGAKEMLKSAKELQQVLAEDVAVKVVVLPKDIKDPSELAVVPNRSIRSKEITIKTIEQYENEALGNIPTCLDMWLEYNALITKAKLDLTVGQALVLGMSSRLLANPNNKQLSIMLIGQSASGKNHTVKEIAKRFPIDSFIHLTSISDKALYYMADTTDFDKKIIYIDETTGEESEDFLYIVRQLLSEGGASHKTVINGDLVELEIKGRLSVISTMTPRTMNHENDTRFISVYMPNTKEDISRIILSRMSLELDEETEDVTDVEAQQYVAYQNFLESKDLKVTVPFIRQLTEALVDTFTAMEQTRDYEQLITMIKTATILNYFNRKQNENGQLIAEWQDYTNVLPVANQVFGMSVGATVTKDMASNFEKIQQLFQQKQQQDISIEWLTANDVAEALGIHRTNASNSISKLVKQELLERKTKPNSTEWERKIFVRPNTQSLNTTLNESFLPTEEKIKALSDRASVSQNEVQPTTIDDIESFETSVLEQGQHTLDYPTT